MALDTTDLLTVLGKYVKTINVWNGYLTALTSAKGEIFTVLEAEDLEDLYVDIPSQFAGFQSAVTSWISSLIGEVEDLLVDEAYILEQLPIFATDVTSVLNAIFDHMEDNSQTIESSVVTLGGSDLDYKASTVSPSTAAVIIGQLYATRLLDGVSSPSSIVNAHTSYTNVESQLAKSCTVYAKCTDETTGSEVMQLFSDSPFEASYTADAESPGTGPTIVNVEANNLVTSNYDFSLFSGDNPTGWTIAGGSAGTDWQASGEIFTSAGPLRINTAGVTVKKQLTGLTARRSYFFGASYQLEGSSSTGTVKFRLENVDGLTIHKDFGSKATSATSENFVTIFGFWSLPATVNLDDVYICFEYDAEGDAGSYALLNKVVAAPTTYYNGLGWAYWNPANFEGANTVPEPVTETKLTELATMAIVNNDNGVFQTFFRKAFNIQLPTADSPTISDTLAT